MYITRWGAIGGNTWWHRCSLYTVYVCHVVLFIHTDIITRIDTITLTTIIVVINTMLMFIEVVIIISKGWFYNLIPEWMLVFTRTAFISVRCRINMVGIIVIVIVFRVCVKDWCGSATFEWIYTTRTWKVIISITHK